MNQNNIKKSPFAYTDSESKGIDNLIKQLEQLKEIGHVNEDSLNQLINIETTISSTRENFMWRIFNNLKQNRMLD